MICPGTITSHPQGIDVCSPQNLWRSVSHHTREKMQKLGNFWAITLYAIVLSREAQVQL